MMYGVTRATAAALLFSAAVAVAPAERAVAEQPVQPLAAGRTYRVTLLTGDAVTVRTRAEGCPLVTVEPATAGRVTSQRCDPSGHVHVVPADAAPLLGRTLEPALFDVTTLIANGFDDARSAEIPLIVTGTGPTLRLAGARTLASIGATAGRHRKSDSSRVRAVLKSPGATKLWLDRTVRADPPSTGAAVPDARSAGPGTAAGDGARVAVVDTGVDDRHPDLAGRVVEQADFTGGADPADRHGHGTLVAGIIAGSGEASGGRYRGVAPGAQIVSAKVLDADGHGTVSNTIAAMQWAAQRADVVNMSLGGLEPSDGSDPLSQAVDALSADGGPLFVISAGNAGPADGTVTAPGAAASALTVGALDNSNALASTSSRGPLGAAGTMKPELVAPGADIVGARGAGTGLGRLIGDDYTAATGTSVAAPQVAGAAALLHRRHPAWPAAKLKAVLAGTAAPLGGDVFASGAGRLDLAAALGTADVVPASPPIGLGPITGAGTAELGWTNRGRSTARVALSAVAVDRAGRSVPVRLSATALTIAPKRTAAVTLRIEDGAPPGTYAATVTARHRSTTTRTLVTFRRAAPDVELRIEAVPLPDTAPDAFAAMAYPVNLDDPRQPIDPVPLLDGSAVVSLPAGRYSVLGEVWDTNPDASRVALAGDPDLTIGAGTVLRLDGSRAEPLRAEIDGVEAGPETVAVGYVQTPPVGRPFTGGAFGNGVFVVPGPGAGVGTFRVHAYAAVTDGPAHYDLLRPLGDAFPAAPGIRLGPADKAGLARIDQHFHDAVGGTTEFTRFGLTPEGLVLAAAVTAEAPATRVDYVTPGTVWVDEAAQTAGDELRLTSLETPRRYGVASVQRKDWFRLPMRPDWHPGADSTLSFCTPGPIRRTTGNLHVELSELVDLHGRFDCLAQEPGWTDAVTRRLTLYRDGELVGSANATRADFAIPRAAATYRLVYEQEAGPLLPVSQRVTTAWQFRSTGAASPADVPVPLLSLDYELSPGEPEAGVIVRQAPGVPPQSVTALTAWTSVDDGASWTRAATAAGPGRIRIALPAVPSGTAVSLRVSAVADGGSAIDQTIVRAYRR